MQQSWKRLSSEWPYRWTGFGPLTAARYLAVLTGMVIGVTVADRVRRARS